MPQSQARFPRRSSTLKVGGRPINPELWIQRFLNQLRLERNYSNVHADVQQLVELGLVEKDDDQRLIVPFDDVRVEADASLMAAA